MARGCAVLRSVSDRCQVARDTHQAACAAAARSTGSSTMQPRSEWGPGRGTTQARSPRGRGHRSQRSDEASNLCGTPHQAARRSASSPTEAAAEQSRPRWGSVRFAGVSEAPAVTYTALTARARARARGSEWRSLGSPGVRPHPLAYPRGGGVASLTPVGPNRTYSDGSRVIVSTPRSLPCRRLNLGSASPPRARARARGTEDARRRRSSAHSPL
jgi:hypothetical protein